MKQKVGMTMHCYFIFNLPLLGLPTDPRWTCWLSGCSMGLSKKQGNVSQPHGYGSLCPLAKLCLGFYGNIQV